MPQLTTAQIYNAAISPAPAPRQVDFWSDPASHVPSDFHRSPVSGSTTSPRAYVRTYRTWLWGCAVLLKTFGILVAFVFAIRAGWSGAAAAMATLAGLLLRFVLEATSRGD